VERLTLRGMRHTFASHLAMRGGSGPHIQKLMGHADYQQTETYLHLHPDYYAHATRILSEKPVVNLVS
jgi:integrase